MNLTLGELILALEARDPDLVVPIGFNHPHSYRGYYEQLAFEPATNVTVREMLDAARSALGETYQGWKGGDFMMQSHTYCWLANEGDCGDEMGRLLLGYMLDAGTVPEHRPVTRTNHGSEVPL